MRILKISNLKKDKNGKCMCTVHFAEGFLWWKKEWTEVWSRDKGFNYLWEDEDGCTQDIFGVEVAKLWKLNRSKIEESKCSDMEVE